MSRAGWLALVLAVPACTMTSSVGPFVRRVTVDGYDLLIERCMIERGERAIAIGACTVERQRLPITAAGVDDAPGTVELDPVCADLAVSLTAEQVLAGTAAARVAARACGTAHGLHGAMDVRVEIDGAGVLASVDSGGGGPVMAECVRAELAAVRFPRTRRGATYVLHLVMP